MKHCPICSKEYPDESATCTTDGAMLVATHLWANGTIIKGKYLIVDCIGTGGMGTVYKAEHLALEEVRALKVLPPTMTGDQMFVRRFRQEAQAARRLRHPNAVHVDDLDQAEDGCLFIAMDYIDGVNLRQLMQKTPGHLPPARTIGMMRGVADALSAAHALGMVHRDVKPENVLLARDSQGREVPKVADFGIVAIKESSANITTGLLLTPQYASPEQWHGMKSGELDGRTDLYSLGMTWYETLTGQLPFHAHTFAGWMKAHLEEIPEPPSKFCPDLAQYPALNALVLKLLAKDRNQRPADASAFLQELSLCEAQVVSPNQPAASPTARHTQSAARTSVASPLIPQAARPTLQESAPPHAATQVMNVPAALAAPPASTVAPSASRGIANLGIAAAVVLLLLLGGAYLKISQHPSQTPNVAPVLLKSSTPSRDWSLPVKYDDPDLNDCKAVAECIAAKAQAGRLLAVKDWQHQPFNSPFFANCMEYTPCLARKNQADTLQAIPDWSKVADKALLADCMGYAPCVKAGATPGRGAEAVQNQKSSCAIAANYTCCRNSPDPAACLACKKKEGLPDCASPY